MRKRSSIFGVCGVCLLLGGLLTSCDDSGDGLIHTQACTETFTACGGDPEGTWDIVAVCTDGDIANEYDKVELPACRGVRKSVTLAAAGSVFYNGYAATYHGQVQEVVLMDYSPSCTQATQGMSSLDPDACNELQRRNTDSKVGKVTKCKFEGGNCKCTETTTAEVGGSYAYGLTNGVVIDGLLTGGTRIVEEDGSVYDFCITGDTMVQRENIYGDAYVVTTLKKR
jgi:hypothetical protein